MRPQKTDMGQQLPEVKDILESSETEGRWWRIRELNWSLDKGLKSEDAGPGSPTPGEDWREKRAVVSPSYFIVLVNTISVQINGISLHS